MPCFDFIEVLFLVNGHPIVEYDDPDGQREDDHRFAPYVEVRAGQKVAIRVTLLPGFDFKGASHVYISMAMDQQTNGVYHTCAYDKSVASNGKLMQQQSFCFSSYNMIDERTGSWFRAEFEIGALGIGWSSIFLVLR